MRGRQGIWLTTTAFAGIITATAASAQGMAQVRPTGPVTVRQVQPITIPQDDSVEPLSALGTLSGNTMPDEGSRLFWTASRNGSLIVKAGDTFSFAYLSRGKPSYSRVALLFTEGTSAPQLGALCGDLNGDHVAMVEGQITAEPASDDSVKAAQAKGMDVPGAGPLYLVRVTAAYNGDLITAAALKKTTAIRAFPLGPGSKCLRKSGGAYIATLAAWSDAPPVVMKTAPVGAPYSVASATPVGWSPSIDTMNCSYIISDSVSDPAWEEVLKAKGISRSVGTHFTLCQGEFTTTYNNLPDSTKVKIAIKNALGAFAHAFNWTAGKFQSIASTLATPLKPLIGDKAATVFTEALMGQLPGSPLTGNMNMVVDQGCSYVKAKVAGSLAENTNQDKLTDGQKKQSDDAVQQACDAVKDAMRENASANSFLKFDLTMEPRAPIMYVRVNYMSMNGAPPGTMSKDQPATLTVKSNGGPGPNTGGNGNFPQKLLFKRDVTIPGGPAGTSVIIPYLMEDVVAYKGIDYTVAATAYAGLEANANGYVNLHLKGLRDDIPPPAK